MANLNLRIPDDLKQQVEEAAARDDRTTTGFVIRVLKDAVLMQKHALRSEIGAIRDVLARVRDEEDHAFAVSRRRRKS